MESHIGLAYGGGPQDGIHALSILPGGIETGLQDHLPEMKPLRKDDIKIRRMIKSTDQGAAMQGWATVGGKKGGCISGRPGYWKTRSRKAGHADGGGVCGVGV